MHNGNLQEFPVKEIQGNGCKRYVKMGQNVKYLNLSHNISLVPVNLSLFLQL